VVFGRAAAMRAATIVKPNSKHEVIPESETQKSISRFDKLRNSNGGTPTSALRDKMQRTMQKNCAVFRDAKILKEGMEEIKKPWQGMDDISVSDKSLIFNTDLIETLEFDNLIRQSLVTMALEKILKKETMRIG
jgi:succinate dehydrogenase / fumarate reductase flavoprotein subunit